MFTSVTKQLKRAVGAMKSVLAIAGTAAAALDPRLKSYLREGEELNGLEPIQLTLVRWIEADHNRLEECEAVASDPEANAPSSPRHPRPVSHRSRSTSPTPRPAVPSPAGAGASATGARPPSRTRVTPSPLQVAIRSP